MPEPSHGCIVTLSCIATVGDWECRQPLYRDGLCIDHDAQRAAGLPLTSVQPFEDAAQQPDTTKPTRECPPATTAPQNGVQGRDAQLAAAYRLGHEHGSTYATDRYADGYAAAKRFYGDTAPLALDKIRDRLDEYNDGWRELGHPPYPSTLIDDLQAILDTAKEPR